MTENLEKFYKILGTKQAPSTCASPNPAFPTLELYIILRLYNSHFLLGRNRWWTVEHEEREQENKVKKQRYEVAHKDGDNTKV